MGINRRINCTTRLGMLRCLALALLCCSSLRAQPMEMLGLEGGEVADISSKKPGGFSVKKEDEKIGESLADFERYRDKKAWDRAFKSLTTVIESGAANGMTADEDGFYILTKEKLFRNLISLPPAGREAYRLFNDAKAKQLFESLLAKNGSETIAELRKLVDQYFITAVGLKAADRLGDAYFEAGDYVYAARTWGRIIEADAQGSADDSPSPARMHFKRAVALARAHRAEPFAAAFKEIQQRFPENKLTVGGRDIDGISYLKSLAPLAASPVEASTRPVTQPTADPAVASTGPIELPNGSDPVWRMHFFDGDTLERISLALQNNGWAYQAQGYIKSVPPVATDGKRVFIDWAGVIFAIDVRTGKMLWRSNKFSEVTDNFQQFIQNQPDTNRFTLTATADRLFAVTLRLDRLTNNDPFRLFCLAPDTGKKIWTSDAGELEQWGFVGSPLIVGDMLYITAHPKSSQDITLLAINSADGKLIWSLPLGLPQISNNYRGMPVYPIPKLLHQSGTLYVLTNNGALLAIDLLSKSIDWAFTYEIPPPQNANYNPYGASFGVVNAPGAMLMHDGLLYIKETGLGSMFALDLSGPSLKWRRSVESSDTLVGMSGGHAYLIGPSFSMIDLTTRAMLHSYSSDVQVDSVNMIDAGDHYLANTARGIRSFDLAGAQPGLLIEPEKIEKGSDYGGLLLRCGDKLISVSNFAVTAYPVRVQPAARDGGNGAVGSHGN